MSRPAAQGRLGHSGRRWRGSPKNMGPEFVADFEDIQDQDERAQRSRDAFERVNYLLSTLGVRDQRNHPDLGALGWL